MLDTDAQAGISGLQQRRDALSVELDKASEILWTLQTRYSRELELVREVHGRRVDQDETQITLGDETLDEIKQKLAEVQGKAPLVFVDVDAAAVARVVAEWTGVPVGNIVEDELQSLLMLEQDLAKRVVGQGPALNALAESLRTAKAGLKNEQAPLGVFLLVGPSGVGKTETALALADLLFGGEAALTTINMSEYQESHTVSQLKGSPPGYVGYGQGGILTEAIRRRPYSVLLLDEVEKAHRDVLDMFYQVFDRGMMRDGEGREIDFCNCVILMTSNLASTQIDEATAENADITQSALLELIQPHLVAHFQPALLARFQSLVYRPLDSDSLESVIRLKLEKVSDRLLRQHGVHMTCEDSLIKEMAQICLARESGARNCDAFLNQSILPTVSRELLARMICKNMPERIVLSSSKDGKLTIDFIERDSGTTTSLAPTAV